MKSWWEPWARKAAVAEAVRELQTRYCRAFDTRDEALLRDVYAPEAVFDRPGAACQGIDDIVTFYRQLWSAETFPTRHFPTVFELDEISESRFASKVAYQVVLGRGEDLWTGWGDYDDVIEVRDDRPVIVSKRSTLQGLLHVEGGWTAARSTPPPWSTARGGDR